jgi:hypothetical protein
VKITAAVVETEGAFALQDVDPGYLRADEVLVELVASGICPTGLTAPAPNMAWLLPAGGRMTLRTEPSSMDVRSTSSRRFARSRGAASTSRTPTSTRSTRPPGMQWAVR